MSSPSTFNCFGLVIHGIGEDELLSRINDSVIRQQTLWIVTANPEILLEAKRDPRYWQTIREADLRIVDGVGLQFIGWLFQSKPKRISGVDIAESLLKLSVKKRWSVALIGGHIGIADRAAWAIRNKYPDIRIRGEYGGTIKPDGSCDNESADLINRLKTDTPDVLLVAFGHPKQEMWINKNIKDIQGIKVIMGVGGTFDYWAGKISRAPLFLRRLGLEWLWRLIVEPRRWMRILRAVVVFPIKALRDRVKPK